MTIEKLMYELFICYVNRFDGKGYCYFHYPVDVISCMRFANEEYEKGKTYNDIEDCITDWFIQYKG